MREPSKRAWSRLVERVRARSTSCAGGPRPTARLVLLGIVERTTRGEDVPAREEMSRQLGMGVAAYDAAIGELQASDLVYRLKRGSRPSVVWPDYEHILGWVDGTRPLPADVVAAQVDAEMADEGDLSFENRSANGHLTGDYRDTNAPLSPENRSTLARGATPLLLAEGAFADVDEAVIESVMGKLGWWKFGTSKGIREEIVKPWVATYSLDEIATAIREAAVSERKSIRLVETILRNRRARVLLEQDVTPLDVYGGRA